MTHLRIELNTITENVTSSVIHKLYETAKAIIDAEEANDVQESLVSLKGNLLVSKAYGDEIDWLEAKFPDLHITAGARYIRFADDAVYARLSLYLGDGTGITSSEITNANIFSSSNDSNTGQPYFRSNTNITSFNELGQLPQVISIPYAAFKGASNLTSIDLSNITSLGNEVFYGCSSLSNADLSSCTSIGSEMFWGCSLLRSVTLPQGTSYIPNGMFYNCSNLLTINGVDLSNISYAGHYCFLGCSSLQLPSTISISGNMVGAAAFLNHSEINKIVLPLSSGVTLYNSTLESCTGLTLIENHNSIIGVGWGSFQNCYALAGTLDLSNLNGYCSNIRIYNAEQGGSGSLFRNCRALTKIIIGYLPDLYSSPYSDTGTFCNCYSLTEIDIARLDTIILSGEIYLGPCLGCSALLRIILRCTQVPTINLNNLNSESGVITCLTGSTGVLIYVPDSALNDYKSATGWSLIANYIHPLSEIEAV